ncbi:UDP-N-acetylmuramoyl-L-alanine--D-glutamate ligase [Candidatus Wolfebacteria bacterium]|nr:UDP-N-acetylmuramoyl-L-alanine--D-glutamate ligase [Candidatus Wolfebacteria bacterium]
MKTTNLKNKKIAILGFGREGKSLLKFFEKNNLQANIKILDQKKDKNYLKKIKDFDVVYRSPGIPYNLPEIQKAIKKGIEISSVTKLFFEKTKNKIIGITGTKGKGTTVTLLYKILKFCGKDVYLAGNIGKSPLEILPRIKKNSLIILELSSFQLQDLKKSPSLAAILEIFPDHLDSHKRFKEYLNAKSNIAKWQKKSDKVFYFKNDKYSKQIALKSKGEKNQIAVGNFKLFKQKDLKTPGFHNFKNAAMASSIALYLKCPKEKILKIVKNFSGNEHRLEFVKKIKNVSFYNDSASTNPQTAIAAINAFKEPKILIAGGKDKKLDYSPLKKALKKSNTEIIILFGENKNKIKKQITKSDKNIVLTKNLKSAIKLAYLTAQKLNSQLSKSIIILFSPASASFDMFKDYADRGNKFKDYIKKLK